MTSLIQSVGSQGDLGELRIGDYQVKLSGNLNGFEMALTTKTLHQDLHILVLSLTHKEPSVPSQITLDWCQPSHDIAGVWTSNFETSRKTLAADWLGMDDLLDSQLTRDAPVYSLFGSDDSNKLTVAVSDAINRVWLNSCLREEDASIHNTIRLFGEPQKQSRRYDVEIRFDYRSLAYYEALKEVVDWWAEQPGYTPLAVPDSAKLPTYSTWYSFHQDIAFNTLLEEVKAAKQLGFETIIVDDGWQTDDTNRGYRYAGDWQPQRLPNMQEFVAAVHAEGMKAMLWYSVPFVGESSQAGKRFSAMLSQYIPHHQAFVLDPRYPEVREYLAAHYRRAVAEWGWDGLKLDFIDCFKTYCDVSAEAAEGRDYLCVYDAVDGLLRQVIEELRAINPQVLIEFRQHYTGPRMRAYSNMFRVHDSPNLALVNRVGVTDLRFLSGNTAVHSDMLMWHPDEAVENAAFQLLNVLFSVPQISVKLSTIAQPHLEMVRFYINYWISNRDVLIDGELQANSPLLNYSLISSHSEEKKIIVYYADQIAGLTTQDKNRKYIDLVNAKNSQELVMRVDEDLGQFETTIRDCKGVVQSTQMIHLVSGLNSISVPVSGIASLVHSPG